MCRNSVRKIGYAILCQKYDQKLSLEFMHLRHDGGAYTISMQYKGHRSMTVSWRLYIGQVLIKIINIYTYCAVTKRQSAEENCCFPCIPTSLCICVITRKYMQCTWSTWPNKFAFKIYYIADKIHQIRFTPNWPYTKNRSQFVHTNIYRLFDKKHEIREN